jgi:hypothetical protein
MSVAAGAMIGGGIGGSLGSVGDARDASKLAKAEKSDIKKANLAAVTEANALQDKSESQARARVSLAAQEQERSKSIFSTLGGSIGGGSIAKRLLGQ